MIETYKEIVRLKFINNPARYMHILGVYKDAKALAKIHNVDLDQAKTVALFHDFLKDDDYQVQMKYISLYNKIRFRKFKENYHALSAANYIKKIYNINSKDIINAIKYHVTLRKKMTDLDKILYIADYTEETRIMADKRDIFKAAEKDLNEACYLVLKSTIDYLKTKNIKPYYRQIKTYKYLKERVYGKTEHDN